MSNVEGPGFSFEPQHDELGQTWNSQEAAGYGLFSITLSQKCFRERNGELVFNTYWSLRRKQKREARF